MVLYGGADYFFSHTNHSFLSKLDLDIWWDITQILIKWVKVLILKDGNIRCIFASQTTRLIQAVLDTTNGFPILSVYIFVSSSLEDNKHLRLEKMYLYCIVLIGAWHNMTFVTLSIHVNRDTGAPLFPLGMYIV